MTIHNGPKRTISASGKLGVLQQKGKIKTMINPPLEFIRERLFELVCNRPSPPLTDIIRFGPLVDIVRFGRVHIVVSLTILKRVY